MDESTAPSETFWIEQNLGKLGAVGLLLGAVLFALGLYWMPSRAYDIQRAFRADGVAKRATVVGKQTETRTYVDGTGTRGRRKQFDEHLVTVRVGERDETIGHLVLASDLDRLKPGDEVDVTMVKKPIECHDQGSRTTGTASIVLTSSLARGPLELLGWSRGRGIPGASIAALVVGGVLLVISALFLFAHRLNRKEELA